MERSTFEEIDVSTSLDMTNCHSDRQGGLSFRPSEASGGILTDYHVHIGQYNEKYFVPEKVVQDLLERGVNEAWISSTTSCIYCKECHSDLPNQPTARQIQDAVLEEMRAAILEGKKCGVKVHPLFWLVPEFEDCGVNFEEYFAAPLCEGVFYEGFKIHPRAQEWNFGNGIAERVFCFADKKRLSVLIHTGNDTLDSPKKFEPFIKKYSNVAVQLAHIKNLEETLYMLQSYKNVFCDSAMSPQENIDAVKTSRFVERLRFGSDFPMGSENSLI